MAFSTLVVSKARKRLDEARQEQQSQQRARLQDVYARLPRVRELDTQIRSSMARAAQAAFAQGQDGREAMERIKQENLALQQERKALIDEAFGKNYLDERPICPHCGGLGYVGSNMCSCLQELCRQEQKKELSLLACGHGDFADFDISCYPDRTIPGSTVNIRDMMRRTFTDCKLYAETFGPGSGNLLFSGDTGLGKTFLSACIACKVADKGYSVVYESAVHLFEKLEKARFSNDEQALQDTQRYTSCDLLIVDDLGTEMVGQFVTTALYTIINDRLLAGKATIISTNLTGEALEKRYSTQILSRLRGSYKRVPFLGDDIRLQRN